MAYDELLANRIQLIIADIPQIKAKKMFGGIGYLLNGNMACGVIEDKLIVRVGVDAYEETLQEEHVAKFDITGPPMRGWVMVEPTGILEEKKLNDWLQRGLQYAAFLPSK